MKILVTGVNGFLGSVLVKKIINSSHEFIGLNRDGSNGFIACNLENPQEILSILNQKKPEAIINCAAKVDFSDNSLLEQYATNTVAPAIMALWCSKNKTHLLQTSGTIVHGNKVTIFDKNSPEHTINNYGRSKLLADKSIQASGCKHTIIRFGGIFGANGPNHLGINRAITDAKLGITPTIFGNGSALRNYIHVEDAAKLLLYCIENSILGIYYAGGLETLSIAQMLTKICEVYLPNKKVNYKIGKEAIDQVVKVSSYLPKSMTFKQSLQTEL